MPRPDALAILRPLAAQHFGESADVTFAAAHGCLDVLGALEAEGGGTLAQMTLPGQVAVALRPQPASEAPAILRIKSAQIAPPVGEPEVTFPLGECLRLPPPQAARCIADAARGSEGRGGGEWAAALLGLFWLLHRQSGLPLTPRGADLLIHGDLPMCAGQASSTALLAAAARALLVSQQLSLEGHALAHLVASAEALANNALPAWPPYPARGHVIDALTCLHPRDPVPTLLRYSAQPHRFVGPVPLPEDVRIFALDTGIRYTSARDTLDELRVAAAMGLRIIETIYRDLGQRHTPLHGYLTNTSPLLYRQYFRALLPKRLRGSDFLRTYGPLASGEKPEPLPLSAEELDSPRLYRVRTAVDHLIAENEHAEQFLQAMEELADDSSGISPMDATERQRTLQRAGRLLLASHHSYRLRLDLSCREADSLVDSLMEAGPEKGVYGARITGIGGGGTVVALLQRSTQATDALLETLRSYRGITGLTLGVVEV
jgi:L-arabinokinase